MTPTKSPSSADAAGMSATADRDYVSSLFPEATQISDPQLSQSVIDIWVETWRESAWDRIEDAPKNPETVDPSHALVAHTRSVTVQGIAIAETLRQFHRLTVDLDLVIAGCLLHDVSKLLEYEPLPDGSGKSHFGEMIQHATYGMHKAFHHRLPIELIHIIGSHTTQSRLSPRTLEAVIVHYADFVDSDALMWEAGRKLLLSAAR